MEPHILLAHLRALIERAPDLNNYSSTKDELVWLAQANALLVRWNRIESIKFESACDFMSIVSMRPGNIAKIFSTIYRAIADLELQVPANIDVGFDAGGVYDFFKALNKIIASAEKSIFIIDPYLDHTVFDHYLTSRNKAVNVRLLSSKSAELLLPSTQKYNTQFGSVLDLRKSKELHDRIIFIDEYVCWALGQSLKDAAKAKPTYIVQLPPDIVPAKLHNYEDIWSAASVL